MTPALRGHLAMLAFSGLIAGSFSLGGMMANMVSPTAFSALRFLLAAGFVGAAGLATGQFRAGDGGRPGAISFWACVWRPISC